MAVLVTGGAGYIGSHTAIELLNSGKEIVILDNFYNSCPKVLDRIKELSGKDFAFEECDIRDADGLRKVFEKHNIDSVIHFAGLKAVGESCEKPLLYYENNISGTVTLCQVMAEYGCKKMVFSSSATVYGEHNISPLNETMKTGGTTNPYGTTKYMIELIDRVSKEKCVLVISHKMETLMSTDMIYVCTHGHLEKLSKSDNISDIMSNILAEREKYV